MLNPTDAVKILRQQHAHGREILNAQPVAEDEHDQWITMTEHFIVKSFGKDFPHLNRFKWAGMRTFRPFNAGAEWFRWQRVERLTSQLAQLQGFIEILDKEIQLNAAGTTSPSNQNTEDGHKIFLVHGRDDSALNGVARFLEKLDCDVVILREQPNKGLTIIEKIEEYSDVGFAVVLLTPDDRGHGPDSDVLAPRARQNVILELGFFIGRIGRNRVCALYVEGVEKPSDYDGVAYVALDNNGAWKLELAKELKAAKYPVDMKRAV